ncbi:hypothetical protein [Rodentibacter caecimuris]|uniref:hypothetical protein n=1 Tax=Rodentibacter caecimuris TaxID=1796644 RepID=UPI00101AECB4|nr:hypothetical protein [Rodentibacter heylii]
MNTNVVSKDTARPPNINIRRDELQHPWLHYGRDDLLDMIQGKGGVNDLPKLNHKDPLKVLHFCYSLITMFKSVRFITRF